MLPEMAESYRFTPSGDFPIHGLDHLPVGVLGAAIKIKHCAAVGGESAGHALRFRLVSRCFPRPVRCIEVQAKQEGLSGFCVAVDRGYGPLAQQLRQIARLMGVLGSMRAAPVLRKALAIG